MGRIIVCIGCGEEKEHEAFGMCKRCYKADYREKNRERLRKYNREYLRSWKKKNPGKMKEYCQCWRERNPERAKAGAQRFRENNRETLRLRTKDFRQMNPDYYPNWWKHNPEKMRAWKLRRRGREMAAEGNASVGQISARVDYYGGACYICGQPYEHIDHVIPLSRGGSNWPANLRPICASCNLTKGAKPLQEILQL